MLNLKEFFEFGEIFKNFDYDSVLYDVKPDSIQPFTLQNIVYDDSAKTFTFSGYYFVGCFGSYSLVMEKDTEERWCLIPETYEEAVRKHAEILHKIKSLNKNTLEFKNQTESFYRKIFPDIYL